MASPLPRLAVLCSLGLLTACGSSGGGSGEPVLGSARIGLDGGELRVLEGPQAGLVLTVPPGALDRNTTIRIVQAATPPLAPESLGAGNESGDPETSTVQPPGLPYRLEPVDVQFRQAATLRMPYRPEAHFYLTGLGNVRVRQQSPAAVWDREPVEVDVLGRYVETRVTIGGTFQVVTGPKVTGIHQYFPPVGAPVPLGNGARFHCEPHEDPRLQPRGIERWRFELLPLVRDMAWLREGGYFVGRESAAESWLELWPGQAGNFEQIRHYFEVTDFGAPFATEVFNPATTTVATGGSARLRTSWRFAEPRTVAGQRFLDVLELRLAVRWNRVDLLPGEDALTIWLAPGVGVLAVRDDTTVYERTTL